MNPGSPFFAEIVRMISSSRPGGTLSASIGVTKPYLYSRSARFLIVSEDAIVPSFMLRAAASLRSSFVSAVGRFASTGARRRPPRRSLGDRRAAALRSNGPPAPAPELDQLGLAARQEL